MITQEQKPVEAAAGQKKEAERPNKLNDLNGTEWIKFTKSWFIHRPVARGDQKILHPASFPESLVKEFVKFFTKRGGIVVDPFLGTGSTLVASLELDRSGVGFEIVEKYAKIAEKRVESVLEQKRGSNLLTGTQVPFGEVVQGDSRELSVEWRKRGLPPVDFCITSPPYWDQLKRNHIRQKGRTEQGLDTVYSSNPRDIGNIEDYKMFLSEMKVIFDEVYKVMKPNGYLVVITNNVFVGGRVYPLAFDTVSTLSDPEKPFAWVPKDEKIWCQDDKALLPLGVFNAWVGNRHHQYCLIFRKEEPRE